MCGGRVTGTARSGLLDATIPFGLNGMLEEQGGRFGIARRLPDRAAEIRQYRGFQVLSPASQNLQGAIPVSKPPCFQGFDQFPLCFRVGNWCWSRRVA